MLNNFKEVNSFLKIIKRNGTEVTFQLNKIINAIKGANGDVHENLRMLDSEIQAVAERTTQTIAQASYAYHVEQIQDLVIRNIINAGHVDVGLAYALFRYKRELLRHSNTTDNSILTILEYQNEDIKQENSNKNPMLASTQRDYMAGEVSKDITDRLLLPKNIVDAHNAGIIQFHDKDYFAQHIYNCSLINLEDMLQNGTVITDTLIEKPHRFITAANIATQISAQVASSQYGGQTMSLAHLAPFIDLSRQEYIREFDLQLPRSIPNRDALVKSMAETRLHEEIKSGVQEIQYQLLTLMTTNGQTPFITIFMWIDEVPEGQTRDDLVFLIEEVLRQRIKGVKNEQGVWIAPAFPKLIYALDEDNITPDSKYWSTTVLAAKCTAKRLVPDYISVKKMQELKGDVYPCMGCRSFLTPDRFTDAGKGNLANAKNYSADKHKYYGRFNQGVVTLNLVDVALSSGGNMEKFWEILEDRSENLVHRGLRIRHERLLGTPAGIAPLLFCYGAIARLKKTDVIDHLLYDGYSTISFGYAGIYEMTKYMTGKSHTEPEGREFALSVMKFMNDKCAAWKKAENIDYSIYGTPIESATYRFAKCLQERFGKIPDITDHNYITNSYHINVREKINAFDKLTKEAEFQALSPGGAISYVEVPDLSNNIEAVLAVLKHIYDNIIYAELNTKADYCATCGFTGEIKSVKDENGKWVWECPNCKERDQNKLTVVRRTCGYIGSQFWNQGRTEEIHDRVLHL